MVACGTCRRSMESLSDAQRRLCRGCRSHFGLPPPSFHEAVVTLLDEADPDAGFSLDDMLRSGDVMVRVRSHRQPEIPWVQDPDV